MYSVSSGCGAPVFAPTVGATAINLSSATILGGDDCVISLNVTATDIGAYVNVTGLVFPTRGCKAYPRAFSIYHLRDDLLIL